MIARVRVTCKAPVLPDPSGQFPLINGILPSFEDVRITVVDDDGVEHDMPGVCGVRFECREGPEPLKATVSVLIDELDVEGLALVERIERETVIE